MTINAVMSAKFLCPVAETSRFLSFFVGGDEVDDSKISQFFIRTNVCFAIIALKDLGSDRLLARHTSYLVLICDQMSQLWARIDY